MSRKRLFQEMDSEELTDWQIYSQIEPHGQEMENWRFAMLACLIANCNRDSKSHPEPFQITDFMPSTEEKEAPGWEDLLQKVKQINTTFGGKTT